MIRGATVTLQNGVHVLRYRGAVIAKRLGDFSPADADTLIRRHREFRGALQMIRIARESSQLGRAIGVLKLQSQETRR